MASTLMSAAVADNKRKRIPGKRCVVMFCNKTNADNVSLHQFPKNKPLRQKWIKFVLQKRDPKSWQRGSGYVCSDHFKPTDYQNMARIAGFSSKLVLKKEAYPTIQSVPNVEMPEDHCEQERKRSRKNSTAITKINAHRTLVEIKTMEQENELLAKNEETNVLSPACCFEPETGKTHEYDGIVTESDGAKVHITQRTQDKATQKSYTKPERRSKGIQTYLVDRPAMKEYRDAMTQCNLSCELPPSDNQVNDNTQNDDLECKLDEDGSQTNSDGDYIPMCQSDSEDTDFEANRQQKSSPNGAHTQQTFLVFESCLLSLFETCPVCGGPSKGTVSKITGSMVRVLHQCQQEDCAFQRDWYSQPSISNLPVGNLLMSTSILLSGCCVAKSLRLFKFMNMASISPSTFYRHSRSYISPTIIQKWKTCQQEQINKLANMEGGLVLAGDGRCDSPGYCAKFGSFTFIEQRTNKVLDFQLVQSNEVKNSAWMENEGLVRSINMVNSTALSVAEIITDRHKQNTSWIKKNLPNVKHYFDIWHVSKGLCKKIDKLAAKHDCKNIGFWRDSISNHMYWCAASTPDGDRQIMQEKWKMLPLHIQNIHINHDNQIYKECGHGELEGDAKFRLWLQSGMYGGNAVSHDLEGSSAAVKLEELLLSQQLLKDVSQLSPVYQTSSLEAKHSLDIHFVPKHTSFSYWGMYTRLCLSALHYNTNSEHGPKLQQDGTISYAIRYPKSKKGKHSVRHVKEEPIFDHCFTLIDEIFTKFQENPNSLKSYMNNLKQNTPPPLAASAKQPDKTAAVNNCISRYNKRTLIH